VVQKFRSVRSGGRRHGARATLAAVTAPARLALALGSVHDRPFSELLAIAGLAESCGYEALFMPEAWGRDALVTLGALAWLFLRLAAEGELKQELIEQGLDPVQVARAVRYGRAKALGEVTSRRP
jgi:hypothetical protein